MKKFLAVLLSIMMVVPFFSFNIEAATITTYSENFESYEVDYAITEGQNVSWLVYDQGENGYWKGYAGTNGWLYNNNGSLKVATANLDTETTTKALHMPGWATAVKEINVSPNTDYSLSFKYFADKKDNMDFFVLDATNVTGYSFKAYTSFSPITTTNKVKAYDNTILTALSQKRNNGYTANQWNTYTTSFTTSATTTKIVLCIATETIDNTYIDDISLTYEFRPEVTVTTTGIAGEKGGEASAKLSNNDTQITYEAYPYDTAEFLGWYKNGTLYSTDPIFTEDYNAASYVKLEARFNATAVNLFTDNSFEDIAAGTKYSGSSTYHWVSGRAPTHVTIDTDNMTAMSNYGDNNSIVATKSYSGTKSLSIPVNGHYVYKIVKVEKNTDYRYSFYYYQESKNLFYNNQTGMKVIGLDYENLDNIYANEIAAEDGTETILHLNGSGYASDYTDDNGKVLQKRLNTYPQSDNLITRTGQGEILGEKATVGAWDKAEFIFNSEDFEYVAIPFSSNKNYDGTNNGVYIDHVTLYKRPEITSDYSFAIIGDQQKITGYNPEQLHYIYDHILDNKESKNIKFVLNLGDINETYANGIIEDEWILSKAQMDRLEVFDNYTFVRGNHDDTDAFLNYFPISDYSDMIDGSYSNNMLNTYQKFEAYGVKYLVFSLDVGFSNSVMDWASQIIENHPDYNVIVTTHGYLKSDGTILDKDNFYSPGNAGGYNHGTDIWEKFASKHSNIVAVISGHIETDHVLINTNTGVNNNTVLQMLINPQGMDNNVDIATGMVAYFHFTEGGKKLYIEYYSTIRNELRYERYIDFPTINDNNTYKELTVNAEEGGYVKLSNGQLNSSLLVRKASGTTTLFAEEVYGNEFLGWYDGDSLITAEKSVTVNVENKTITAKFKNNNLLTNGGFEDYDVKKNYLKGVGSWENITTTASWASISILDNINGRRDGSEHSPYSGSKMLAFSQRNQSGGYIEIPTTAGKDYTFSMKWLLTLKYGDVLNSDGVTPIKSQIEKISILSEDGGTILAETNRILYGTAKWEDFNINFNSGNNTKVRISIYYSVQNDPTLSNICPPTTGDLYIDDMSLIMLPEPEYILGDVDGNGEVDGKDLTTLRRYLADWNVTVNLPEALDVNKDGFVTGKDVTHLARYFAEWDGYTL